MQGVGREGLPGEVRGGSGQGRTTVCQVPLERRRVGEGVSRGHIPGSGSHSTSKLWLGELQARYLILLCLSLLSCKMGILQHGPHRGIMRVL